ncbi:hypothetical protein [Enterococcus sp. CWB-B31]|uniref:hypothetical protein n=1 Tax=Enterococcus sp. CWB-B31 TaxID=2885159 RepID=UPI001E3E96D7|nr:hypothetical protein [Enterococcus sp. CWB-B31]MCB5955068.1 hypothetical protein [Enterococcus sp. CWB-B31]
MDKLYCEACGSNELTKRGDSFVCNYCNTSYLIKDRTKHTAFANEPTSRTVETPINKTERHEAPAPQIYVPFQKKVLSLGLMLAGLLFLILTVVFSQMDNKVGVGLFSWWSVLLLNVSYTTLYGKKVF